MQKPYLLKIREVQSVTGPNMCLASCKFLTLKLLGFVDPTKTLYDFLRSPWARKHSRLPLSSYWGANMSVYNDDFNKIALPAAINDASAGVKAPGINHIGFTKGFTFNGHKEAADMMLIQRTPLVVGVSIHGGRARDHFVVIFKDPSGRNWVVDPWPGSADNAVVELDGEMTFTKPTKVHLTADAQATEIPCGTPFFGYFM